MIGGYMGRTLVVDLTTNCMQAEALDDGDAVSLIGGYGLAAKFLLKNQPGNVDPLGAENWLCFATGPLTGSPAPTGARWTVAAKSPLTGTWGDANAGGWFGVTLKAAGFDAVFVGGMADEPVYLLIDQGSFSLHDATALWGLDTFQTEETLQSIYGRDAHVACIGQAGERLSLISGVVHAQARVAARSGLGAVMGAKRLKALVVRGKTPLPLSRPKATEAARRKYLGQIRAGVGYSEVYRTFGTPGATVGSVHTGDSPIRNWSGRPEDFPEVQKLSAQAMYEHGRKRRSCWGCPIGCWGDVYLDGRRVPQPEYETVAAFGPLQLVSDLKAILTSNELCNRYGIDTISAGATIAFAMESFEKGLISQQDIGFSLLWGDGHAATRLVTEMALREGFGAVLADGSRRAAQRINPQAQQFAIHIMGQELAMHDPRLEPGVGLVYLADATPGRHTQACDYVGPPAWDIGFPGFAKEVGDQRGRGRFMKPLGNLFHVLQASGACLFGYLSMTVDFLPEWLTAVTGHDYSLDELLVCGERIACLRQAFNVREAVNLLETQIPWRAYGQPPLDGGPNAGVTVKIESLLKEYLGEMRWAPDSATPDEERMDQLGIAWAVDHLRKARSGSAAE